MNSKISETRMMVLPPPFSGLRVVAKSMTDLAGSQSQGVVSLETSDGEHIKTIATVFGSLEICDLEEEDL